MLSGTHAGMVKAAPLCPPQELPLLPPQHGKGHGLPPSFDFPSQASKERQQKGGGGMEKEKKTGNGVVAPAFPLLWKISKIILPRFHLSRGSTSPL